MQDSIEFKRSAGFRDIQYDLKGWVINNKCLRLHGSVKFKTKSNTILFCPPINKGRYSPLPK